MAKSTQKYLPLADAATFARANGIGKEFDAIRGIPLHGVPNKMAVEKGHIVALFREYGLLDEFIDEHWPRAKGPGGPQLLEMYERFRRRQLAAANKAVGGVGLSPEDADVLDADETPYFPSDEDSRAAVLRQIKVRRGQQRFRNDLRTRYSNQCMISGCRLLDLVEAAHIKSYRGVKDNDPKNGLLLRADLHTLFDLDFIGIEPDKLTVRVHPDAKAAGYGEFDGVKLICDGVRPSKESLALRWKTFQQKNRD